MNRTPLVLVAVMLAVAGCSDDSSDSSGDTASGGSEATGAAVIVTTTTSLAATATTPPSSTGSTGTTGTTGSAVPATSTTAAATTPPTATPAPQPVVGDPVVASEVVATLDAPVGLGVRPGDQALYVIEQAGRVVRVTPNVEDVADTAVVADLTDRISAGGERGLLGIAFSADGNTAWLDFTNTAGDTTIAEYPVAPDGTFDTAAERILTTINQPYPNHNGGDVVLGPDGMLYVAMGDGGAGGDPERRASDPTNLLGKLLRIDPTPSGDVGYSIPPDNPFASGSLNGVEGAPEVWSWGLRNPWRISFDPISGELWIADVGQNQFEEINVVAPTDHPAGWGLNFGWSAFEGTERYNADVDDPGDTVFPVLTYPHGDQGCSVSGGAVYRGTAIPELEPAYVYSDYCSGILWALDLAGGRNLTIGQFENVTSVRTGPDGELYVLEAGGDVHRLLPG